MTLAVSPASPIAGDTITVSSSLNVGLEVEHVVVEITSRPTASALPLGLALLSSDEDVDSPLAAAERDLDTPTFTPDVPGEYGVTLHLVHVLPELAGLLGADVGNAESYGQRIRLKAVDAGTVDVGGYADLPIATERGDGATLRLTIVGSTVTAAELIDATTEKARVAALQSTVTAALAAIASTAVATALGAFQARVTDLRTAFMAHIASTVFHDAADSANVVARSAATTDEAAIQLLNEMRERVVAHESDSGPAGAGAYHTNGDSTVPLVGAASSKAQGMVLLSDLRERVFERHRVKGSGATPPIHINAPGDAVNVLSAPTKLDDIIVAFLDALDEADPAVAAGEPEGLIDAAHLGGFTLVTG